MAKALITVIGCQKYEGETEKDKIEMKTIGTIDENDSEYIVSYNEEYAPGKPPLKVKLTIAKDESRVEMLRTGAYSSCLIIEKSKRHLCNYGTEYGEMLMGIFGRGIEVNYGNEGSFKFYYDIDVNGATTSQNDVTINFRIGK